jgi:putative membrane protein
VNISFPKNQIATAIAILFHAIGLIGILYFDRDFFVQATVLNLLLMFLLIVWTQPNKNIYFILFILAAYGFGMLAEIVGVNTGSLFGQYQYGKVLGPKLMKVPFLIGINWFIIVYCCGISIHTLLSRAIMRISIETHSKPIALKSLSVIVDGATMAVFFDWIMEPVAEKLGFWQWGESGDIPLFNYITWLMISMSLMAVFHFTPFPKQNKFAVHLLLIQMMFFLLLRTFL